MEQILFIGDVHIKFNNLKEVEILENKILELKEHITFIVIAGDILDSHEKINTQLLNKAYNFIKTCRLKAPVYVLVGNHDYINNQQFLTSNHWMNGLKEWSNIFIVDKPMYYDASLHTVSPSSPEDSSRGKYLFMPYVPVGRFIEALDTTNNTQVDFKDFDWKDCVCIFAHQEMKNCKMGPIQSVEGDEWDLNWPMLISGHIHERQNVQNNILYPGSVINHSFGSDNQGLSLISFSVRCGPREKEQTLGSRFVLSEIKIDIGLDKKSIIYEQLNTIDEKIDLQQITKNNKLSLEGEIKDIAAFKKSKTYKTLIDKQIKVVFRVKSEPSNDKQTSNQNCAETTPFSTILSNLIIKETDHDLEKDFQYIKKNAL